MVDVRIGPAFGDFGGVSQHVRNLAAASAFRPSVFRLRPWSAYHPAWRRALWFLETNNVGFPDPWLLATLRGLRRADLVHLHAYPFWIPKFLKRRGAGPKVVYTVHQIFHREDVPAREWPRWRALNERLYAGCRAADAVISVAAWQVPLLAKHGIEAEFIPNGVDFAGVGHGQPDRFRRAHGVHEPFFLSAQALLRYKRPELLAQLAEGRPDSTFVGVGRGMTEAGLRGYLGRDPPKNLRLLGEIPRDDLVDAFSACRAFVLTSSHDTFPTSLLEAMAAGRPVVASRSAGPAEIVEDGRSGFLFAPDDAASLAEAAGRAWDAPASVAAAARARAEEFSWPRVAARVDAVYSRLLGAGP